MRSMPALSSVSLPAQHGGGIASGRIEDRTNVRQRQACVAVGTDLAQALEILFGVDAVIPGAPPGPRQQADGFVVQHRAARQIAAPRQACDGQ